MPTREHEIVAELFRQRPAFAAELLADQLGLKLPHFDEARCESIDFSDVKPAAYAADAVVALTNRQTPTVPAPRGRRERARRQHPGGSAVFGIVVEVQRREDEDKRSSWPIYVSTLAARLRCPAALLVVCTKDGVARWAAEPIPVGEPDFILRPLVLGPSATPKVTDPDLARRHPELSVLSARANGATPDASAVFAAFLAALHVVRPDHATLYYHLVLDGLKPSARDRLKELTTVTAVVRNDPRAAVLRQLVEGAQAEGRAEGEARAVLAVLAARSIDVPDEVRERISACNDLDQLETWIRRAATATTVQDLFD